MRIASTPQSRELSSLDTLPATRAQPGREPTSAAFAVDGLDLQSDVFVSSASRIDLVPLDAVATLERSPGFALLASDIQSRMREEVGRSPALLASFQQLAASPSFRGLPQVIHLWAVYQVAKHVPPGPGKVPSNDPLGSLSRDRLTRAARETLTQLLTQPGFALLSVQDQHRMLRYVGGIDGGIGGPARADLANKLTEARNRGASDAEVARMLSEFVTFQHPTATFVSETAFAFRQPPMPYTLSAPIVGQGEFGKASFTTAFIAGRAIRIVVPEPRPEDAATADQIAAALALLPLAALRTATEIILDPNPAIGDQGRNGGNGKTILYMHGWKPQQILDNVIHEIAHSFSDKLNGNFNEGNGTQDPRWNPWLQAIETDGLFPASYGKDNWRNDKRPGEDYAEALNLYWRVKGTPLEGQMRELFPARFALLDQQSATEEFLAAVAGFGARR